jgi:hypothetical protein
MVWVQGATACGEKESLRVGVKLWKPAFSALHGRYFFFFLSWF